MRLICVNLWPQTAYYGVTLFAFSVSHRGVRATFFNIHVRVEW